MTTDPKAPVSEDAPVRGEIANREHCSIHGPIARYSDRCGECEEAIAVWRRRAPMRPFWVSWWCEPGTFELHRPWWVSGERGDGKRSICAAILANDECSAKLTVQWAHDDRSVEIDWRFCEAKDIGWSPFSDRFRRADWMIWPDVDTLTPQPEGALADLLERLEAVETGVQCGPVGNGDATNWYRNPDGPEAAQAIRTLIAKGGEAVAAPNEAKLAEIISDAEIIRVHGNSNFGSMSPREVVNDGVRKYAVGFTGGHTQLCILLEHGLITKPRPDRYDASLTKKGKKYARALLRDALFPADQKEDGR